MTSLRNKVEDILQDLGVEDALIAELDAIEADIANVAPSQTLLNLAGYTPSLFEPIESRNRAILARLASRVFF